MTTPLNSLDDNAMNTLLDKSGVLSPYPMYKVLTPLHPVMVFRSEEVTGGSNRVPITGYTTLKVHIYLRDLTDNTSITTKGGVVNGMTMTYDPNIMAWVLPSEPIRSRVKSGHKYCGSVKNAVTSYWSPSGLSDPLLNPIHVPEFEATDFSAERCLTTLGYENVNGYFVWGPGNGVYYYKALQTQNGRGPLLPY